jgi:hypothetical protein
MSLTVGETFETDDLVSCDEEVLSIEHIGELNDEHNDLESVGALFDEEYLGHGGVVQGIDASIGIEEAVSIQDANLLSGPSLLEAASIDLGEAAAIQDADLSSDSLLVEAISPLYSRGQAVEVLYDEVVGQPEWWECTVERVQGKGVWIKFHVDKSSLCIASKLVRQVLAHSPRS